MSSDQDNTIKQHFPDIPATPAMAILYEDASAQRLVALRSQRRSCSALIGLLADDSTTVLAQVRSELTRLGRIARPALLRGTRNEQPRVRSRARQILLQAGRRHALARLVSYSMRRSHELETALSLLDSFSWPETDFRPYRRALDAMGDEVRKRMHRRRPGLRQGLALAEYLGGELGFSGPSDDHHHPDNISLAHTIERKRGLPLTLCAIYTAVAKRAGIQAHLLPFPGHVLLRIEHEGERAIVDPFGGGRVLTERKCLSYLASHGLPYRAKWFKPASDTAMFARQVGNLLICHRAARRFGLARTLGRVLDCLEQGRPDLRRDLRRIR
ncbi:MAG: regulator of sirC expression with transglutaminase-like and TPR domain [Planctomycetota bacterium]|jgi:regulator of sirC expression with transglutaminase-like and TPR domain